MNNFGERRTCYQNAELIKEGMLKVSEIHSIYWEESGNPNGLPAIILHGGPGAGSFPSNRGYFDPEAYRIIQFDQRGCGKSTPFCSIEDNTTQDLIEDIEKLRNFFGIDKWHVVFGGSWGATLALVYAESHPERVSHLVLRGIFLGRKWENEFLYQHGTSLLFPDEYNDLKGLLTPEEQKDVLHSYHVKLQDKNVSQQEKEKLAIQWVKFELQASKIIQSESLINLAYGIPFSLPMAVIETYYLDNLCFMRDNQILEDAHKIKHIPTVIVQGRCDALCPVKSAWELSKLLDQCEFHIIPDAGHSSTEPGILDGLIRATDKFKKRN